MKVYKRERKHTHRQRKHKSYEKLLKLLKVTTKQTSKVLLSYCKDQRKELTFLGGNGQWQYPHVNEEKGMIEIAHY